MTLHYEMKERIAGDDFVDLGQWDHEGVGTMSPLSGGMRLHCAESAQGAEGCMAFFKPDLPDQVAIEYEIIVHSQGGLVINYIALRGLKGEDALRDRHLLEPRTGVMRNYFALKWGLQSYHLSFSRFNDEGIHTQTSNWRRNPGLILVGHGHDPVQQTGRKYRIRLTKDKGALQFFVDGQFAHGCIDRDTSRYPIPDYGKFGLRLIGKDVAADIFSFNVHRIAHHIEIDRCLEHEA